MASLLNQRKTNSGGAGGHKDDLLVKVHEWDLEKKNLVVSLLDHPDEAVRNATFTVSIDKNKEVKDKPDADFVGGIIDSRMKDYIADTPAVLQNVYMPKGFPEALAEGKELVTYTDWVHATPEREDKLVNAILTATGSMKNGTILRFQAWEDTAYDTEDDAAMKDLGAKLDELADYHERARAAYTAYKESGDDSDLLPVKADGVIMMRGMVDGEVVSVTPAISLLKEGDDFRPVRGADVMETIGEMEAEIKEKFGEEADVRIDVLFGKAYRAGSFYREEDSVRFGSLASMRDTKVSYDTDGTLPGFGGGMYGGHGILWLSTGKEVKKGRGTVRKGEENEFVVKALASRGKAALPTLIKTADGVLPELAEGMVVEYARRATSENAQSEESEQQEADAPSDQNDAGPADDMPGFEDDMPGFEDDPEEGAMAPGA